MYPQKWISVPIVLTFGLMATSQLAAQPIPFMVALSGTPAPAGGNYGAFTLTGSIPFPVVNENGSVYFFSTLSGGSSTAGLFAGTQGAVQAVALQGTLSPSGGTYTNSFSDLVQNTTGQVAFSCSLVGTNVQGLYAGTPGALQTIAVTGNPAPGGGGNYSNGFTTPVQNLSGVVAFSAALTGGTSTRGLFIGTPGSVQATALQGNPAPAGGNYSSILRQTINGNGQVVFQATLTGGSATNGIFFGTPGSLQTVALQGNPAPSGGNFATLSSNPVLNNAGQVAFSASTTGAFPNPFGIFEGTPGSLQTVALQGNPAPAGGNYSSFTDPVLNGSGRVAFRAGLTGGSATSGIFAGLPGSIQAVALQGNAAPGGGNYSTFTTPPQLNGLGQIAFLATLDNGNQAIYSGAPGALVRVIGSGDVVDVDPGPGIDLRTVFGIGFRGQFNDFPSGGQDGRGVDFTDNGLISYTLTFTDGSSGIFFSSLTVIPEPTSIALLLVLSLGTVGWYGRRKLLAAQVNKPILEGHEEALEP